MHPELLQRLDNLYTNVLRKMQGDADSHDAMRQLIADLKAALEAPEKTAP
jgi:hypothetical protein